MVKIKKLLILGVTGFMTMTMTSAVCSAASKQTAAKTIPTAVTTENVVRTSLFIQGYEWGPAVPKLILELEQEASSITGSDCSVITAQTRRTVTDIYLCGENGEKTEKPSRFLAICLAVNSGFSSGESPFRYDTSLRMNKWADAYHVAVDFPDFTADGTALPLTVREDCINNRICPDTDRFSRRNTFTGTYLNSFTNKEDEITLRTAAYEPETLSGGEKNPLIIWLHGQGEGGTDPDIALLGNEVTALARENIQSYFSTGEQTGAYVLAVQCETYWMDEGDGANGRGSGVSRYTEALMDTIRDYVESTPDVDPSRIYLGGCSNGGYMTMNMLVNYPDYFAAAYPCCEAYSFYEFDKNEDGTYAHDEADNNFTEIRWMTKEKTDILKNIPIWFVLSADDQVVDPALYTLPTYQALLQAGAKNCWLSLYESVIGTDSPDTSYLGHFSWIYLFNDQVKNVQDPTAIAASSGSESYGTTPSNNGGGAQKADGFDSLFAWLNAQSK